MPGRGTRPMTGRGPGTRGAGGASAVRVRLTRTGPDAVSLAAVDVEGGPVLSVASVVLRDVSADELATGGGLNRALYRLDWTRLADLPDAAGQQLDVVELVD